METPEPKKIVLQCRFMGDPQFYTEGRQLTFLSAISSKAVRLMIMLLYFHRSGVSRSSICENLYENSDADFDNSFKALLYRLRRLLSEELGLPAAECLILRGGILRLSDRLTVESDVDEFRDCVNGLEELGEREKIERRKAAADIYGGELLPSMSGEQWVIYENALLRQQYSDCVSALRAHYEARSDYEAAYACCHKAMRYFPYDEEWAIGSINAHLALGHYRQALAEYEHISSVLFDELGVYPSEHLLESIRRINDVLASPDAMAASMVSTLKNDSGPLRAVGAYYVNYPSFYDCYKMLKRVRERDAKNASLVLISVTDKRGVPLEAESEIVPAVSLLRMALCRTLRSSDMVTRFGRYQMLVMLWGTPTDNVDMVMGRIAHYIEKERGAAVCEIAYTVISDEDTLTSAPVKRDWRSLRE